MLRAGRTQDRLQVKLIGRSYLPLSSFLRPGSKTPPLKMGPGGKSRLSSPVWGTPKDKEGVGDRA